MVDAMKASGPTDLLRFDLHEGVNHSRLGRVFYMSEPYDWFLKHSIADSVRTVDRTIEITKEGMANAYRSMPGRRNLKVVEYKKPALRQAQDDAQRPEPVTAVSDSIYIVKPGDTLAKIAKKTGTTVDSLCEKNNITRRTILHIGHRLVL